MHVHVYVTAGCLAEHIVKGSSLSVNSLLESYLYNYSHEASDRVNHLICSGDLCIVMAAGITTAGITTAGITTASITTASWY